MEFCFYCSRFPTPGQAWGCTPGNSRLGAAAYAALAGEASARPRRGGCTPGNSRLWSWSPVGTVQDRPRRQPRRRLNAALVGEVGARPRRGGCTLGNSRPGSWSPVGTVQDRPRRRLNAALVQSVGARPRHGGMHPGQCAPVVLVPGGDRSGPTEAAAETAAQRRACGRG